MRRRRGPAALGSAVATMLIALATAVAPVVDPTPAHAASAEEVVSVPVGAEPDGTAVTLDATVYTPPGTDGSGERARHPAVILAHGFGGSKADLADRARALAGRGYVVLAYSARGFGASGGRIHLNAPGYEIADARALVDLLADRPDVQLDSPGDPRVGVAGGSYGGALALMLAGADPRIDATVAAITWNDLAEAFLPGADTAANGVFKRRWASVFFSSTVLSGAQAADTFNTADTPNAADLGAAQVCGRFDPTVCRLFLETARTGTASPQLVQMLHANSPAPTLADVQAPTLLVQGMRDSLFGLDHSDATANALRGAGTPVAVRWFDGGHDGGTAPGDEATLDPWLDRYLTDAGRADSADTAALPVPAFTTAIPASGGGGSRERTVTTQEYPGLHGVGGATTSLPLAPADTTGGRMFSPPGGDPAAMSGNGGLGALGGDGAPQSTGAAAYRLAALPGQSVAFDSAAAPSAVDVVGAPTVRLRVTSTARDATLFVSLWRLSGAGPVSPRGLVTPVKVATEPGVPVDVEVALPAGTYAAATSSRWRVLVSTSDAGFVTPTDARAYEVTLADPRLVLPTAPGGASDAGLDGETVGASIALAALLASVGALALIGSRKRHRDDLRHTVPEYADVPLVVEHLVKTYKDGHRAVDDVSWRAEAGQVVGLLGPNGAGKTTTMRMLVGLIRPDSGQVHVLGEPAHAGSPVLARVGALIEGPGFLPHLTGRANLHAYWQATGRDPADAYIDEALEVAALGDALERPVRTYSQGMKQRLGIAQAMLGRPEVLLLDEPTNGLDPPQIAAMRPILRAYADTGRTVVVSSHLLAEVEQTCTHVVVMNRGQVVLTGSVPELTGDSTTVIHLQQAPLHARNAPETPDAPSPVSPDEVAQALRNTFGERLEHVRVDHAAWALSVSGDVPRAAVVAAVVAAGARVIEVTARRHLEEVFLGVIGQGSTAAASPGSSTGDDGNGTSPDEDEEARMNRLRQVRAR